MSYPQTLFIVPLQEGAPQLHLLSFEWSVDS